MIRCDRFSAAFQRSLKISHTVLHLAGPLVRRDKRVMQAVRSSDERVDTRLRSKKIGPSFLQSGRKFGIKPM